MTFALYCLVSSYIWLQVLVKPASVADDTLYSHIKSYTNTECPSIGSLFLAQIEARLKQCGSLQHLLQVVELGYETTTSAWCLLFSNNYLELCDAAKALQPTGENLNGTFSKIISDGTNEAFCSNISVRKEFQATVLTSFATNKTVCRRVCTDFIDRVEPLCAFSYSLLQFQHNLAALNRSAQGPSLKMPTGLKEALHVEKAEVQEAPLDHRGRANQAEFEVIHSKETNTEVGNVPDSAKAISTANANENNSDKVVSSLPKDEETAKPVRIVETENNVQKTVSSSSTNKTTAPAATNTQPNKQSNEGNKAQVKTPTIEQKAEAETTVNKNEPTHDNGEKEQLPKSDTAPIIEENAPPLNSLKGSTALPKKLTSDRYLGYDNDVEFEGETIDDVPNTSDVKVVKPVRTDESEINSYPMDMEGDSYFFSYFMMLCIVFVLGYVGYHNKHKILAIIVEGRRGRRQNRGRRPNSANYHKLDSNLEEAVTSACNKTSSQVIY